jgi:hypothetical protein
MSIKLITAPQIEPVTVDEVKLHTHIDYDVEDSIISAWIESARVMAENFMRRSFIAQIWEMTLDSFPVTPLLLQRSPLMQLISIKYYDTDNTETTLYYDGYNPVTTTEEGGEEPTTNADFIIDPDSEPARIELAYGKTWPAVVLRPANAVKVRYAAGYGLDAEDVPANIRDAIMLYCAYRNENRAGEVVEVPKQFYDLLRPGRIYLA